MKKIEEMTNDELLAEFKRIIHENPYMILQGENEKRMNEIVAELSKNPMAIRLLKEID